jgi:CRP-like cAMP-binding protein
VAAIIHRPGWATISPITRSEDSVTIRETVGPNLLIVAKISQETLAEMIGTTRARVSFFMNKFRKLGLIDYNGHLQIHSSLLNVVLHDDPHIDR